MTTYYRDADVWITSTGVRMNGRDLRLDELLQVWHTRGRRSWGTIAGRGMVGLAILTPLVIGLLALAVAFVIDASTSTTIALGGGGVLVGLATLPLADVLLERIDRSYDRGSRTREIWARTAGGDVLLLRSADAARFGRIYRALQRALEPATRR
ncbi:hypothetical protein KOI35_00720 [Actinoplanes bogorensis]|uniref:Uncharacterized protein n=1 Tax=Paractinoplanes bogorensis TaxID=1610840 RepID=A0ABS5YFD0_9ACTN|nr:DUF6232 family protein [Actinoplanes bogorensis]MBU2662020.1 hypothetical protein [Actinoplanes bogorensis]